MGGFKYQYHNPPPQAPNGAQGKQLRSDNATRCDRPCRTVPLVDAQLLGVTVTPSTESKNSLRLAITEAWRSVSRVSSAGKVKISCPAHACEMFREGPILYIQMELAKCKFSDAEPHKIAQYLPSESEAREFSGSSSVCQELCEENVCRNVLYASSSLPQKVPPSQYSATFVKARGLFGGRFGSRAARGGFKSWSTYIE
ncbi:hypothetical protein FN846DRAFT_956265 [Sphaerosporella brunnea]|uniref:Uncharacterized protein n=1 Tax=Sphaerosporella brunnea TaxID=1250544 RepID=A0A5J5ETJ7_9PEZI|nr:hypothetical protein FN846DRAFT_956265 [Sphaerosporella brunnea]